jgi:hypothetical protein
MEWRLQDAKNRFSELVRKAQQEALKPSRCGAAARPLSFRPRAYDALLREHPSLIDHLLSAPTWDDDLVEAVNARAKSLSEPPTV